MKPALPVVVFLLAAGLAHADIVLVERVDGGGMSGQMTVMVGAGKIRSDIAPQQVSTITDIATGNITTLMHAQKSYMVISSAMAKAMLRQATASLQQAGGAPAASPAPPKATGRTDKINGYAAAEYTFSNGNLTASYWICADYPNGKAVLDALARLQKGGLADMTKAFAPDVSTLPGVPVKSDVEINGQKIETELVSAADQPVDPSEYQIPAGYTEVKMPAQ